MAVELKKQDVKTLISLVTEEIDRVGEVKEKNGFNDPAYFYRLVDIRNRLMAMPLVEELPSSITDQEWQELLRAKELNNRGILPEVQKGGGVYWRNPERGKPNQKPSVNF